MLLDALGYRHCAAAMAHAAAHPDPADAYASAGAHHLARLLWDLGLRGVAGVYWRASPAQVRHVFPPGPWSGDRVAALCLELGRASGVSQVELAHLARSEYPFEDALCAAQRKLLR